MSIKLGIVGFILLQDVVNAEYDLDEAKRFIREYLGGDYTEKKLFHFLVYTALIAYYWYVWALLRHVLGDPREDIEFSYGETAKKYVKELSEYYGSI